MDTKDVEFLLDNRLDNPVSYAIQISVSREEINLRDHEYNRISASEIAHARQETAIEVDDVNQFNNQRFLVAEVGELVPELLRGHELLSAGVAAVAAHGRDHVAVGQQPAPPAQDGSQLMVPLFQVVGVLVDVSRRVLLRGLQRRAAAVAGGEACGGLPRQLGAAPVLAAAAPLGVFGLEHARGGLGGELAAEEAVPARGRGGSRPYHDVVGRGRGVGGGNRGGAGALRLGLERRKKRCGRGLGEGEEGEVRRRHGEAQVFLLSAAGV